MKKLILIMILFFICGIANTCLATEKISLEPRLYFPAYNGDQRGDRMVEMRLHYGKYFIGVGKETLKYTHTKHFDLDSYSAGVEFNILKRKVKDLKVEFCLAYYDDVGYQELPGEGGFYFMNEQWKEFHGIRTFDNYRMTINSGIGFMLGITYSGMPFENFNLPRWASFIKKVKIKAGCGLRELKLTERYDAWDDGEVPGASGWIYEREGDYRTKYASLSAEIPVKWFEK